MAKRGFCKPLFTVRVRVSACGTGKPPLSVLLAHSTDSHSKAVGANYETACTLASKTLIERQWRQQFKEAGFTFMRFTGIFCSQSETVRGYKVDNFRDNLRRLRREKGITQAQLSELTGLSKGTIGNYESGTRKNISYVSIFKIANALKVSPEELIPMSFECCPLCGKPLNLSE